MSEFEMKEGKAKKLEPCVAEDVDYIQKANKDMLGSFAKKKFGFKADLGSNIQVLRDDLTKRIQIALNIIIDEPDVSEEEKKEIEKVIPRFLLHPVNKRVNAATPALLARGDMIPCTEDGTPLVAFEIAKETGEEDD